MSEVLNILRVIVSRLGTHICPNGHEVPPTIATMQMEVTCPVCGIVFPHPSAESFAFNSYGACPGCDGIGERFEIDESTLIGDPAKTIYEGAVLPWNSGGRRLSMYAAGEIGVRLDVPYRDLTKREREIVLHGEPVSTQVTVRRGITLTVNYDNAVAAARRSASSESATSRRRSEKYLITRVCPVCHGTRLRPEALLSTLGGRNIAEISDLDLAAAKAFVDGQRTRLPRQVARVTKGLIDQFDASLDPLLDLGLDYLSLARAGNTLSTGERQRLELTSTVRSNTTGMLYVLDEPSVGLHPSNVEGLTRTVEALAGNGNSVVIVEHDVDVIATADWIIEMGPGAGSAGGRVIAQGTPAALAKDPDSLIGPFLAGEPAVRRARRDPGEGDIVIRVGELWNLHDVEARFAIGALTAVAGPSGAGKTALILDSLIPAAEAVLDGDPLPEQVTALELGGITRLAQIDATPIGVNSRSTPATYSGALDALRRLYAETPLARERGWSAGHFSYNTAAGQCPTCQGLGEIDIDVQYLPDITEVCPTCSGGRYREEVLDVTVEGLSIAQVLELTVGESLERFSAVPTVVRPLRPVDDVGLSYLRLGEPTPSLSGGESQRLRIASRLRSSQRDTLYVFDEPSTGLHPLDIRTLVGVFDRLLDDGATIIVIDHDLDLLAAADTVIDMGPTGGPNGGRIVAQGTPDEVAADPHSVTGPYLRSHLG